MVNIFTFLDSWRCI